ncbi:multisubunit potassium/proton antiporter, PhaF subunit [Oryzisolibacter propanilivorax]|uniref:Multisubunit potassium/proton antiporter, PhaF subunit n=2 Tax=Oryzisolibacter propanilivorax TaxID=1527607 RepID=A0A1G9PKX1_9BURK|nr:multisubunit potassium/proton antiporter, PhaF subunit [Oryzisolibacter propanilivorax]
MNTAAPSSFLMAWALPGALLILVLAMLLCLVRVVRGPNAQDRILALDCMYLDGMLLMLLLGMYYASQHYFEAAMLIALLGFVSSTALAKFLLRGEVIE